MRLGTLGGLWLEGASFTRPKPLTLLAYLALEGPRDKEHVATLFWPRAKDPRRSLTVALGQIREAAPEAVATDGDLVGTPLASDAAEFLQRVEAAALEEAEAAYGGTFLEGARPPVDPELEEWIVATREFLAGHARQVLTTLAERDVAAGRHPVAARRAERAWTLTGAAYPEPRELTRLHALLLATESPRAREAAREAAAFELELAETPAAARRALARTASADRSAASDGTPFVGRTRERREVLDDLHAGERLVVLMGPPGVGKTRLARLCAAHLEREGGYDGVQVVPLEAARTGREALAAIATALQPDERLADAEVRSLARLLGDRRLLLVLDNVEQLASEAAVLSELLATCPRLQLLVTSRERLHLSEERVRLLAGLAVPDDDVAPGEAASFAAVRLFVEHAGRARPGFRLEEVDLRAVIAICRRVDGLPLGIELAAAWLRLLSPDEVASELARGLELLEGGRRDAPERHRSIHAAFEGSWRLLGEAEREVFARLAAFRGPFRRRAAQEVAGATIPELAGLVDKSLLRADPPDRYSLHPLLAEMGRERLTASGGAADCLRRHAEHFLALAERAAAHLTGEDPGPWLQRLEAVHDDLNAALAWLEEHEPELALRLATAAWRYWIVRGHNREGRTRLERLLDATSSGPPSPLRARALQALATLTFQTGDFVGAAPRFQAALAEARAVDDAPLVASLLPGVAWTEVHLGEVERGRRRCREALRLCARLGDVRGVALAHHGLAFAAYLVGDAPTMNGEMRTALERFEELGDERGIAHLHINLAIAQRLLGDADGAVERLDRALATLTRIGDKQLRVWALLHRAGASLDRCRGRDADRALEQAAPLAAEVGNRELVGAVHTARAESALDSGRLGEANAALRAAQEAWREAGYPWLWAQTERVAARAARLAGDRHVAARALLAAARRSSDIGDRLGEVRALEEAALLDAETEPEAAAARLGAARSGRRGLGVPAPPKVLRELRPMAARLRELLGSRELRAAWARGERQGPEALAEALLAELRRGG